VSNAQKIAYARQNLLRSTSSGASWFFFIAVLSLVNAIIITSGGNWHFLVGLGITEVIASLSRHLGGAGKVVGIALDVFVAGIFFLFGVLARRKMGWAFIVGMALYAADAVIFMAFGFWLNVGFHALALFFIFQGWKALGTLNDLDRRIAAAQSAAAQGAPAQPAPSAPVQAGPANPFTAEKTPGQGSM
jgi:hypothetical protein